MIMTPGVGFFYGGLIRKKNVVNMITLSLVAFALVSVQWVLFGYSLAFAPDINGMGIIGGLNYVGLNGLGWGLTDGQNLATTPAVVAGITLTVPALAYMVFQLVFATVTLAIVTSVFAERVKLSSFIIFGLLWTTLVYDPLAHWVWGGGWLATLGAIDFAGGTVVHISSGFSALAIALIIRKRVGFGKDLMEPSNIPLALLGATFLWFGWFGFNAGSAIAANGLAASAFVVTNTATAAAALTWMLLSWRTGRPASLSFASGAVAGLVAITPASGFVDIWGSLAIGIVASFICYYAMLFRIKKGLDESCDCWSVHGMGGLWGAIATGLFATAAVQSSYIGLIPGMLSGKLDVGMNQLIHQIIAAGVSVSYAFVVTAILIIILDKTIGMTVKEEEEYVGLDISQHGERAYS